jgi:hypothetical protein
MTISENEKKPSPSDEKRKRDQLAILEKMARRVPDAQGVGCFLCRLFIEDFEKHGKLTDHPYDLNGKGTFPASGKVRHLEIELASGA